MAALLQRLDQIASDFAADPQGGEGDNDLQRGALAALGTAVQTLGPEVVLDILPLHLQDVRVTRNLCRICQIAELLRSCSRMLVCLGVPDMLCVTRCSIRRLAGVEWDCQWTHVAAAANQAQHAGGQSRVLGLASSSFSARLRSVLSSSAHRLHARGS